MDTFRVVLEGHCLDGFEPVAVQAALAKLTKQSEESVARLLSGTETAVRTGVDAATAERYVAALRAVGAACRADLEQLAFDANFALGDTAPGGNAGAPTRSDAGRPDVRVKQTSPPSVTVASNASNRKLPFSDVLLGVGLVFCVFLGLWYAIAAFWGPNRVSSTARAPGTSTTDAVPKSILSKRVTPNLSADEEAIVVKIKAHPSAKGTVKSTYGMEMYPGVRIHYVTDQFGENPACQIEFDGTMADGQRIEARKWYLIYFLRADANEMFVSANFFGTKSPLRLYVDGAEPYIPMQIGHEGDAVLVLTPDVAARLSNARRIKVLHGVGASGEISFTHDFSNFVHVRNIALALCGPVSFPVK